MNTIGFKNFKAFGDTMQTFPNKPITLIYGPNSVGKSSLLHSLIYTKNIMSGGNLDAHTLFFAGDELDLGGFKNFIHKHDIERVFSFESSATKELFEKEEDFDEISKINGFFDLVYAMQNFSVDRNMDNFFDILKQIENVISHNNTEDISNFFGAEWEYVSIFAKQDFINIIRKALSYFKNTITPLDIITNFIKNKTFSISKIEQKEFLTQLKNFIQENSNEIVNYFKNNTDILDIFKKKNIQIFCSLSFEDFYDFACDMIDCFIEVAQEKNSLKENLSLAGTKLIEFRFKKFIEKYSNTYELDIPDEKIPAFLNFCNLAVTNLAQLDPKILIKALGNLWKNRHTGKNEVENPNILEKAIISFDATTKNVYSSVLKSTAIATSAKIEKGKLEKEHSDYLKFHINNIEYFNHICSLPIDDLKNLFETHKIEITKAVTAVNEILNYGNDEVLFEKIDKSLEKIFLLFSKNMEINEIKSKISESFDYVVLNCFFHFFTTFSVPGVGNQEVIKNFCKLNSDAIDNIDINNNAIEKILYGDFIIFFHAQPNKEKNIDNTDNKQNLEKIKGSIHELENTMNNMQKIFIGAELFGGQRTIEHIIKEDMLEAIELTSKILDLFNETNAKINVSYKDEKFKKDFELYVDGEFFASGEFDDTYYSHLFKQNNGWKITLNKEHNFYKELAKLFNIKECVDVTIPDYSFGGIPDMLVELKKHSKTYGEEISGFVPQNLVLHLFKSTINQSIKGEIHYFSPLRFYPARKDLIQEHNKAENSVFGSSKDIWCALANENNANVVNELNEWLSNDKKLKTKYKIEVKKYHLDETSDEYITKLNFLDLHKNTAVTPRDMGLGVTQILPVLTGCFLHNNTTLYVEQPELHLHPAVQCELADEFIHSAKEHNNKFYIETHSEHLLLRIMRRLRHSASGKIDQNNPLYITPDDICLLYVDYADDCAFIRELELDYDGSLLDQWPNGFFEEGYKERFDIEEEK